MSKHDALIQSLSSDLKPVAPAANVDRLAGVWLLVSALYVVLVTHLFGPIRPNALSQLASEPRCLIETMLGALALAVMGFVAFRAAIPGALNTRLVSLGIGLLLLWLSSYVVGLFSPALEPSMLGKRDHCFSETLIYALPPVVVAFTLIRRLYPLSPVRTVMAFSVAAAMMPALYMQIACMYVPAHILLFHILPGFLVVLLGIVIAAVLVSVEKYIHRNFNSD